METGYKPDGWLGLLCRTSLWYDFSTEETFDREFNRLRSELEKMQLAANDGDAGLLRFVSD